MNMDDLLLDKCTAIISQCGHFQLWHLYSFIPRPKFFNVTCMQQKKGLEEGVEVSNFVISVITFLRSHLLVNIDCAK